MNFDDLFDKSCLPMVLKKAKTLSKEECRSIYNYMNIKKPKTILEFGTQYGCSTRVFLEISNWLGYKVDLHSWDILDTVQKICISKKDFSFHLDDITGKEQDVFSKYSPSLVFLDAHAYELTKNLMSLCLKNKVDFMCHDISLDIYERAKQRSSSFTNKSNQTKAEWELYLLLEMISKSLLTQDVFENEFLSVVCNRDRFGLAIIKHKM